MTIMHRGIRRKTTDVLADYSQAHYLQNVRLKRLGELGRRAGLGKSTMAQLAGPVQFMIGGWSSIPFIINGTGGAVTGTEDPLPLWTAVTIRIPDGQVGQPAAPTVVSMTPSPASGTAYPIASVTWTVVVSYDGLSGPLIYTWPGTAFNVYPNAPPTFSAGAGTTCTYTFGALCLPGSYNQNAPMGTVSTTLNGFSTDINISQFTVA